MPAREARRIRLELTPEQQRQIEQIRRQILTEEKDELMARARRLRNARRGRPAAMDQSLALLKAERVAQGLTLAELEARTGIAKSNLSKLENSADANLTLHTLSTYAAALGKQLLVVLADLPDRKTSPSG